MNNETKTSGVPKLNLAPRLTRPLSLWNPLDYFRLLYWVFYFLQAIRWYVEVFGRDEEDFSEVRGWQKKLQWFQESPIQSQLWLQDLIVQVIAPIVICYLCEQLGLVVSWGGVAFGVAFGVAGGVAFGVAFGSSYGLSISLASLRPDLWLWGLRPGTRRFWQQQWHLPRMTILPQLQLSQTLKQWLQNDWVAGLEVIDQLQRYTVQLIPALQAINFVLARTSSEQLISHVAQLSESPHDWDIVKYSSASVNDRLKEDFINRLFIAPPFLKRRWLKNINSDIRTNTPARATTAGFWYLHEKLPLKAEQAFEVVKTFPYGEEMLSLSHTLKHCQTCDTLTDIAALTFQSPPPEPQLRPTTWGAITQLRRASEDIRVVQQAASKSARAYASNRALNSITTLLDNPKTIPNAERGLILKIARSWQTLLLKVTGEIGNLAITKPVPNPYTIGDPVMGDRFIGRDDIMRQLEELWFMSKLPQSIVLYGHRRMGKTSILRNIATRLGADTRIAYINLNLCEVCNSVGEVLLTLTDELATVTTVPKPTDTDLLNLPEITFRRYISAIANTNQKLIIILDEFETLETLISNGKISPDFLAYLRGLIQLSPTIAFAFAGLHTLEEMTADYFAPFFASILPVRVGFLDRPATRQLLANPDPDYPLDFAPDLLDEAHALTNGQPYLIQLIGFHLTRHYNTQVFEQSRSRDAKFTLEDLTTILGNPDFYSSGRYYFTGVWNQAAEQHPQQPILVHLAHHPNQTPTQISQILDLDLKLTQIALDTLKRHDVAHHSKDDRWEISIELFRRWIIRQEPRNT